MKTALISRTRPPKRLAEALAERSFALLWSGQAISRLGDYLYQVALAWWVIQVTGSAVALAGVLVCVNIPRILFLLLGGVAGDRWPRLTVMLVADIGSGILAAVLAILAAFGSLQVWHVYAVSLLFGGLAGFFLPAYRAAVPDVTSAGALPSANALTSLSVQVARVAGPTLGAITIAFVGPSGAFALNALSFFVAAGCVLPLLSSSRTHTRQQSPSVATNIVSEVRAGLRFIAQRPFLWMTIMLYCMTNVTLVGPYTVALPVLVQTSLHAGVATLGLLYATFPVGYILGGLWAGRQGQLRRRGWLIYGGIGVGGLALSAFGLPLPIVGLAMAALINGAFLQIDNLAWTHTLQEQVPRELRGRVVSVDELGSSALVPVGIVAVGALTDVLGAPIIFLVGGGLTALVAGLGLLNPAVRHLD